MECKGSVSKALRRFCASLARAFPVILFFLSSFFIVFFLFGLECTITASAVTLFFSARQKKGRYRAGRLAILLLHEALILSLAALGAMDIRISVLLNILVPFVLVFTQSTQFNPRGYFAYALMYVFFSLMPPSDALSFAAMLLSLWLLTLYMQLLLSLIDRRRREAESRGVTLPDLFSELSLLSLLLMQPERKDELEERFYRLVHDETGRRKGFSAMTSGRTKLENLVVTMIQRFSYMISDYEWHPELDAARRAELRKLSEYLAEAAKHIGTPKQEELAVDAQAMLDGMAIPEGRVRIFIRSILHIMTLIPYASIESGDGWDGKRVNWAGLWHEIAVRSTFESFEMRHALRLALVLAAGGIISYLVPLTHSYWIPLNAFLLLQPSNEDSSYRMMTRPIGTFIGCLIEFFVYPLLPGLWPRIAFALLMISLMYCSVPGTWYHPVFSTCYALTMASMTLGGTTAIALRMLYLMMAVALVFVVNRFFFPMRKEGQFRYTIKAMFRLHNSYWNIIRSGLRKETDFSISTDILSDFHMYYEDAASYIAEHPAGDSARLREALLVLWHMFSELEQIHYLVRIKSIEKEENGQIYDLITAIQKDLYPIIRYEDFPSLRAELHLHRRDIAYMIGEYLRNAERLLGYRDCIPF